MFFVVNCFSLFSTWQNDVCYADDETLTPEQQLENVTNEELSSLDFEKMQQILDEMNINQKNVFGSTSFYEKVQKLLSGDFGNSYSSFFNAFLGTVVGDISKYIPIFCMIIIVGIFSSIISSLRSQKTKNGTGEVVHFACFGVICLLLSFSVVGMFSGVKDCLVSIKTQMDIIFPMLLTFLSSIGASVSVGVYQPAVAILSQVVVSIFLYVIMPLFVFMFVLTVIAHFSSSIKLNKMIDFFRTLIKWIASLTFGVFLAILGVQGIVASSVDGVSIRAAKFALKSYVPILGGYLSDGFNVAAAGSILIKNAVGVGGIFLLLACLVEPLVQIAVLSLILKLSSAILEPVGEQGISNFLHELSRLLGLLLMIFLAISFMYVLTIGLFLCSANVL